MCLFLKAPFFGAFLFQHTDHFYKMFFKITGQGRDRYPGAAARSMYKFQNVFILCYDAHMADPAAVFTGE